MHWRRAKFVKPEAMTFNEILAVYEGYEPAEVWRHFAHLNSIPRPSGQEKAAADYVKSVAEAHGATWKSDARGNVIVYAPASAGRENALPLAIQAHLDMVCEKRPDVTHDFTCDAIRPHRVPSPDGERIYATGTTLGADNGIGAAMALAALTSNLQHGPLELLFTVEEETGLHGAMALDASLLHARRLINLDSEDPDEITIGCAGGGGVTLSCGIAKEVLRPGHAGLRVSVGGLQGGHSGIEINKPLANAIKLLALALKAINENEIPFHLAHIEGGQAHNAIPRDAIAEIALSSKDVEKVRALLAETEASLRSEWGENEPDLRLGVEEIAAPESALARPDDAAILHLLRKLPHGVVKMSARYEDKVETSLNVATLRTEETPEAFEISLHVSIRSFIGSEIERIRDEILQLSREIVPEIEVEIRDAYPGWEPKPGALLETAQRVYRQVFGVEAKVEIVHAGLECGVIADKLPGLEAISFGPLIRGPHTPEEWVDAQSVDRIWTLLAALLDEIS